MIFGKLIKRYKRFLADIILDDGHIITAHCPNSGRMTGCATAGWKVALSISKNPKRKLKYTLEYIYNGQTWICINAAYANTVALIGIKSGVIKELSGYESYIKEVKYGNSRLDILAQTNNNKCYIEVKSCTMVTDKGLFSFPDAPTERGRKHIAELLQIVKEGHRGVMLFIIQREDGCGFVPAWDIDFKYSQNLIDAKNQGVEILCYRCSVAPNDVVVIKSEKFFEN